MLKKSQSIALAIIVNKQQVLLSKRAKDAHQGGLWEFPGGKVEEKEPIENALKRECWEELGIQIKTYRPLIALQHDYPDVTLKLHVYLIGQYEGTAQAKEGQPLAWVNKKRLAEYAMPKANGPIIQAIQLADSILITPNESNNLVDFVEQNLKKGIKLIQLRQKQQPIDPKEALKIKACCVEYQARLLINQNIALAQEINADGLQLPGVKLAHYSKALRKQFLIGVSCHNLVELQQAEQFGAHFALLSPVKKTTSHPLAKPLGMHHFAHLVSQVNLPVYGLGGLTVEDKADIWQQGGQGIAGISCFV